MSVSYSQGQKVCIMPQAEPFKHLVKDCQTSVTEVPNFLLTPDRLCAIVDLPGNADNKIIRELVNFHYIETMAGNLEEATFWIVLKVKINPEEGKVELDLKERTMLKTFAKMFPDIKPIYHVRIIINQANP